MTRTRPGPEALTESAAGCLVASAGACTGFVSWFYGARPALHGGFEGERRDLSLLYLELPVMLLGVPAAALAVWALTRRRGMRGTASVATVLLTLAVLAWACLGWLDVRVPPSPYGDEKL